MYFTDDFTVQQTSNNFVDARSKYTHSWNNVMRFIFTRIAQYLQIHSHQHRSFANANMFARKFIALNLIVHVIMVLNTADIVDATRCTRVPEGSGAKRSPSTGNFRVRLSDDSGVYKPGRQYTGKSQSIDGDCFFFVVEKL